LGTIDRSDAPSSILLPGEGNVYPKRPAIFGRLRLADNYLDDFPILAEVFLPSECLKYFVLPCAWTQANDVNKVLLNNSKARQVFSVQTFHLSFLCLLLPLLCFLFCFLLNLGFELGNPKKTVSAGRE
jgi:hypothetical protein